MVGYVRVTRGDTKEAVRENITEAETKLDRKQAN